MQPLPCPLGTWLETTLPLNGKAQGQAHGSLEPAYYCPVPAGPFAGRMAWATVVHLYSEP